MEPSLNQKIAEKLRHVGDLYEQQGANPYRVSAYRRAADTVDTLERNVAEIFAEGGIDALVELPAVGKGIARSIVEILRDGTMSVLERLRGELDPVPLFRTVPGIGPELAQRIHDVLHVDTLEALESAAYDGRLRTVPGIGDRRLVAIRASLARLLVRARSRPPSASGKTPEVVTLLDVDREYRERAASGALPTISPKRFNPDGTRRLPILHTHRGGWHFTALFSNTARAHEMNRTRDWVVLYFHDEPHDDEGQCTVVTETHGPLVGLRVVRGRERECRALYEASPTASDTLPFGKQEGPGLRRSPPAAKPAPGRA